MNELMQITDLLNVTNVIRPLHSIPLYKNTQESMINRSHTNAPTRDAIKPSVRSPTSYVISVSILEKSLSSVNIVIKSSLQDPISSNIYKFIRKMTVEIIMNASLTGVQRATSTKAA
jgi:hypothetical protein